MTPSPAQFDAKSKALLQIVNPTSESWFIELDSLERIETYKVEVSPRTDYWISLHGGEYQIVQKLRYGMMKDLKREDTFRLLPNEEPYRWELLTFE